MWTNGEEEALYIGLSIDDYWSLNPKQYIKHKNAYNKRKEDDLKESDMLNYYLAQYITYGYHQPKKMPKKPFTHRPKMKKMTCEEMERVARINTILLGGEVK